MAESKTLVEADIYLKAGAHIGTKFKSGDMKRYIYKQRKDGLKVMDVDVLDARIRAAAAFIAQFDLKRVIAVSKKLYGQKAVKEFSGSIGGRALTGRFVPGTFTNPQGKEFIEPSVVVITEPEADEQAIEEAAIVKVPVVALCSTNNLTKNVDVIIPVNNKGRKSLALVYWLLAREILKNKGEIKEDSEFKKTVEEFEYELKEGSEREEGEGEGEGRRGERREGGRELRSGGRGRGRGEREGRGGRRRNEY